MLAELQTWLSAGYLYVHIKSCSILNVPSTQVLLRRMRMHYQFAKPMHKHFLFCTYYVYYYFDSVTQQLPIADFQDLSKPLCRPLRSNEETLLIQMFSMRFLKVFLEETISSFQVLLIFLSYISEQGNLMNKYYWLANICKVLKCVHSIVFFRDHTILIEILMTQHFLNRFLIIVIIRIFRKHPQYLNQQWIIKSME